MSTNPQIYPEDFQFAIEQQDLTLEYAIARLKIIARDTALRTTYALRIAGQNESALQNQKHANLNFRGKSLVASDGYVDPDPEPEPETDWADIIDAAIPIGTIREIFRTTLPSNRWAWMNGQSLPRASVSPDLVAEFDALGAPYNGDGSTTIKLPDKRGKSSLGTGNEYALGASGGEKEVFLQLPQMPQHAHTMDHPHGTSELPHDHSLYPYRRYLEGNGHRGDGSELTAYNPDVNLTPRVQPSITGISVNPFTGNTGQTGGNAPHNNMSPYLVCTSIIKVL